MTEGLWSMVMAAGGMEKIILVLLAFCSVALWSLVFLKLPEILIAKRNARKFLASFGEAESFGALREMPVAKADCVESRIFRAALAALEGKGAPDTGSHAKSPEQFRITPENPTEEIVLLRMQHTATEFYGFLQRGLPFMATLGSTTPFIGLLGTVVGIMTTFFDLGNTKNPNMQVVAPGISGALVATAAGLAVAIPAVVACNWFLARIDEIRESADCFAEKLMAIIRANAKHEGKLVIGHASAHALSAQAAPAHGPAQSATPAAGTGGGTDKAGPGTPAPAKPASQAAPAAKPAGASSGASLPAKPKSGVHASASGKTPVKARTPSSQVRPAAKPAEPHPAPAKAAEEREPVEKETASTERTPKP